MNRLFGAACWNMIWLNTRGIVAANWDSCGMCKLGYNWTVSSNLRRNCIEKRVSSSCAKGKSNFTSQIPSGLPEQPPKVLPVLGRQRWHVWVSQVARLLRHGKSQLVIFNKLWGGPCQKLLRLELAKMIKVRVFLEGFAKAKIVGMWGGVWVQAVSGSQNCGVGNFYACCTPHLLQASICYFIEVFTLFLPLV